MQNLTVNSRRLLEENDIVTSIGQRTSQATQTFGKPFRACSHNLLLPQCFTPCIIREFCFQPSQGENVDLSSIRKSDDCMTSRNIEANIHCITLPTYVLKDPKLTFFKVRYFRPDKYGWLTQFLHINEFMGQSANFRTMIGPIIRVAYKT